MKILAFFVHKASGSVSQAWEPLPLVVHEVCSGSLQGLLGVLLLVTAWHCLKDNLTCLLSCPPLSPHPILFHSVQSHPIQCCPTLPSDLPPHSHLFASLFLSTTLHGPHSALPSSLVPRWPPPPASLLLQSFLSFCP